MNETSTDVAADPFVKAYPENAPFHEAAAEGRLLVKHCEDCAKLHWYPRVVCPFCGSGNTGWTQVQGTGTVYTYSVIRKPGAPYVLAYIALTEGPVLMSTVLDIAPDAVAIGLPVTVRFVPAPEGRLVPAFVPA